MRKVLLITGATGVVGSALVPEILNRTDSEVFLLVRAKSEVHLKQRRAGLIEYWGQDIQENSHRNRIHFINGDISAPNLGLSKKDDADLKENISGIIHSAANVKLDMSLEESLKSSLVGVENILNLQKSIPGCKLDYVSTVGVNGRNNEPLFEKRIGYQHQFFNTYEAGKARAEQLIYHAQDEGFAITIHRPSMVVGNSQTGKIIHFQVFYFILRLISGQLSYGLLPGLTNSFLDTIPSDFVAKIICWSAHNEKSTNNIYHHCTGPEKSISLTELQSKVRKYFSQNNIQLKKNYYLPHWAFRSASKLAYLPINKKWQKRLKLLPQFLDYASQKQQFLNEKTMQQLKLNGINWPWPDEYLDQVISHFSEQLASKDKASSADNN